jgi:hypothetical protein
MIVLYVRLHLRYPRPRLLIFPNQRFPCIFLYSTLYFINGFLLFADNMSGSPGSIVRDGYYESQQSSTSATDDRLAGDSGK